MTSAHPSNLAAWQQALPQLTGRFGDRVSTGEAVRRQHMNTLTWIAGKPPDVVVWPASAAEVAQVLQIASQYAVPVIPFGAGTSLEGHVNAPHGGIALDLSLMNRILQVSREDLDCTVEAGVRRGDLNRHLRDTGLFFSVDPGTEDATLGGMAATRASGTNSVRYGTMRDNVVRLTAVLANGQIVRSASKARKSAAGYDLTRLLVGSEGTLGVITELTLRLFPVPDAIEVAVAGFPNVAAACNGAIAAIQSGLSLARIELLDAVQIGAVNAYAKLTLAEAPTLFIELHGSAAAVAHDGSVLDEVLNDCGAQRIERATDAGERNRLWRARHDAFWAIKAGWPGKSALVTDVCVPISRLAQCVEETAADILRSELTAPIVGHVGDGNFHAIVVFDEHDAGECARVEAFVQRLSSRALAMDGTCSGEHGIGEGKAAALAAETGSGLALMAGIKRAFDPLGILNPGKLFPR